MSGADPVFTDTNVLLYSVGTTHPEKNRQARNWVQTLWSTGAGRLSYQVLHEFYANAVKKLGVAVPEARENVILWCSWQPVETSLALIERAWHWMDAAHISYWDAMIIGAAELSQCRWLLTEDLQDGRSFDTVTVINPFRVFPEEILGPEL